MVLDLIDIAAQKKIFHSAKIRSRLIAASCFMLLCSFFSLIFFRAISVKIPALYIITACAMYLIIIYKNSLTKYEIGIFLFLFIQLLALVPEFGNLDPFFATVLLLSFRYGVSSRSFPGTIVDFLSNGSFISKYFVWHFIFCSLLFFIFLISVYLGSVINKSKNNTKSFVLFLSLLYLTCFTCPSQYFDFGKPELYALILLFLFMAIIDKPYLKWAIPLVALFILSTHLIFIFFYIPFIFILLFYKLDGQKNRKEYIALFFTSFAVIITSFILYILFHKQTFIFPNAEAFAEYLKAKTDIDFNTFYIHMVAYTDLGEHLERWHGRIIKETGGFLKFSGNINILINLPLILLFAYFWIKCFLHEKQRFMKLFFAIPVLLFFYHIPAFFMFYDFGRWIAMIIQIQFMLVFYLIYKENKTVIAVADKITPVIAKNWFTVLVVCSIMLFLEPVRAVGPSDRIRHIIDGVLNAFKFFF